MTYNEQGKSGLDPAVAAIVKEQCAPQPSMVRRTMLGTLLSRRRGTSSWWRVDARGTCKRMMVMVGLDTTVALAWSKRWCA